MGFNELLEKYRKIAHSQRDKGDRFERLMQAYLSTDPKYAPKFKKVWLWNEFPGKSDLGHVDTGIDLVALTWEGDYWAIQCKCYAETAVIDKPEVDSFLSTSGRAFKNEELKTVHFSQRLWISTTNNWGIHATVAIKNQHPQVTRLNLFELQESPVDWEKLDKGIHGEASRTPKKSLRPHQHEALEKTEAYFKTDDRGKLIMACGTGKTFNALRIAENETGGKGLILFLVPSIALLGQSLREWFADAVEEINAICICSDPEVSRKKTKNEDSYNFSVVDLALPASTNPQDILSQFEGIRKSGKGGMTVVFSTYQSIKVISEAQKVLLANGFSEFDLIICDEAHRTTGVTLAGDDESAFTRVHDNDFIKAKKRLYMTATPRLYSDDTKSRAAQAEAVLCSMDDEALYGKEIYRIGFGEAVEKGLLSDYKVLILTLNDKDVPPAVQAMIKDSSNEITTDDASKLIGCINALSKQMLGDEGLMKSTDPDPMRKAVAFCASIAVSKKVTETYNTATEAYIDSLPAEKKEQMVSLSSRHIDGTMTAPQRDELLGWLKADTPKGECRILTNVRCLSEGVDVPSLDAVMFLSARNSQVDVVQSVGRVMRKSPDTNKKYGYIIIPIVVPSDVAADKALDDNDRYRVVWTVLNALRAHDDRFNATVNKIELNKNRPDQILVGRPEISFDQDGLPVEVADDTNAESRRDINRQLALQFEQLQAVVFARMVQKVGDRRYWEQWAKSVAEIAQRHTERITRLVHDNGAHQKAFDSFLKGLHKNINPGITEGEAIEMLSQHIITKPVFDALFENYSFVQNNPMSKSMQKMLDLLEEQSLEKDADTLQKFYESVKKRASGIDNAEGKQRIIIELYDKFFKTAFPKMVERLGIVYTPVEVVDFIIHSVSDILQKEFGRSLSDENVHILDPFTGTGTFITRLLQSGLIKPEDAERKYLNEIHANEIVLLAYYIAAVNIENAYHDLLGPTAPYQSFEGICLTDTFQLGESKDGQIEYADMFPQNSERVQRQQQAPLRVIIGNPPYSVGQKSTNDNAQNQIYEGLNERLADTYVKLTTAVNKNALYDSYMKAFRWSTDRLDSNGGIICFVSNGGWLDGNSTDGFRKSIEKEFSSIYVFNLRGNANTQGEIRKKEAGNVFGGGSKTPITITLLVKNPKSNDKARIYYYDIGDYLNRDQKLKVISEISSFGNSNLLLEQLLPNEHGDWIRQRSSSFEALIPLTSEKKFSLKSPSFFVVNSRGLETSRDPWIYASSRSQLLRNVNSMVGFYNSEVTRYKEVSAQNDIKDVGDFVNNDATKISWSSSLIANLQKGSSMAIEPDKIVVGLYRPFFKQNLYYGDKMIHRRGQFHEFFPTIDSANLVISLTGVGSSKEFSCIISDVMPDIQLQMNNQCFPLYYYDENNTIQRGMFDDESDKIFARRDGISDFILDRARAQYGKNVKKEDIFYYVYGILHNRDYRAIFNNDLKKMLPRLPLIDNVKDFWAFSNAGRKLAKLHLDYENQEPLPELSIEGAGSGFYTVDKMRFPKKEQKDRIHYNSCITISNIPEKAYEYQINGKSAIEWVMERYQIKTDRDSGILNDPNDWASEHSKPGYILDLLLSIITVSVQTVDIVNSLPKVDFSANAIAEEI